MDGGDLNLWTELTAEQYAELRDDIAAHGIRQPISVMADGTVIDGHNRRAIAAELGINCPTVVFDHITTVDQAIEQSVCNTRHRHLKGDQLKPVVMALRRQGWSNVRIAKELDVDESTVREHAKAKTPTSGNPDVGVVPKRTTGSDGKQRPAKRATKAEVGRRRDVVATLAADGYNRDAIAKAIGVSHGTIDSDLAARQAHTRGRCRVDAVPPERAYWRDSEPMPKHPGKKKKKEDAPIELPPRPDEADVASWRRFDPLKWLEHFALDFTESDLANVLAWRIYDALEGGDAGWVETQRELLLRAHDMVTRLVTIVNDPEYREQCRTTIEGREALRQSTGRKWAAK
jgi:transposase